MLTKCIYLSKIYLNQTTNYLLMEEKKLGLNLIKIHKYLTTINKRLMFMKNYMTIIQQRE